MSALSVKALEAYNWTAAKAVVGYNAMAPRVSAFYVAFTPVRVQNYAHGRFEAVRNNIASLNVEDAQEKSKNRTYFALKVLDLALTGISLAVAPVLTLAAIGIGAADAVAYGKVGLVTRIHNRVVALQNTNEKQIIFRGAEVIGLCLAKRATLLVVSISGGYKFAKALGA